MEEQEIIGNVRSEQDARQRILNLTSKGEKAFDLLNERSNAEVAELLNDLSEKDQQRLINAMQTIEGLLTGKEFKYSEPYFLRQNPIKNGAGLQKLMEKLSVPLWWCSVAKRMPSCVYSWLTPWLVDWVLGLLLRKMLIG